LVAGGNPCYMTAPLPEDSHGRLAAAARDELLALARENTVVAVGPGLGRSAALTELVLCFIEQTQTPLVLDADGLNAVQGQVARLRVRTAPLIVTPHPGELARLLDTDVATIQADRQGVAVRFAAEHRLILVLKGQGTIVTDGQRIYVNRTGNPGMATGGTGDV